MDPSRLMMVVAAKQEIDNMTTFFHNITTMCFSKCAGKAHQMPDLTVAEQTCLDRCVVKYMASQHETGKILQQLGEEKERQMQAQQAAMSALGK
jgi:import inner membrane translocase subunit TIM10